MDIHGRGNIAIRSSQPAETCRRIILFPLPLQGHINPMLQLANILYTHGFIITIIHTEFNAPNHLNHPHFTFKSISEGFPETENQISQDLLMYVMYLNRSCVESFKDCLTGLLAEGSVSCLIMDAGFYVTQAVADDLNLPRLVLRTSSLACVLVYSSIPNFIEKGYFNRTKQDYESSIPEYPFMKLKDVLKITNNPPGVGDYVTKMLKLLKPSSGIIWNTFKELEEPELETIYQQFSVPSFTLGPFHRYFSASSSSLIEHDTSILSWLDTQPRKSTIYVSFGSIACITKSEFQQVAQGLMNTGLPFLWVVRPGMVTGCEWLESLPEKFLERVGERGRVVKWCEQQKVLAHPATGCFWTHNGWNSTLESICEGVPMICSPCFIDQPINARYVSNVWKIGVFLEDGFERTGVEMAIKRIMMGKESEEIRGRISCLKEKLNLSLDEGGSSHQSLKSLVDYISSF